MDLDSNFNWDFKNIPLKIWNSSNKLYTIYAFDQLTDEVMEKNKVVCVICLKKIERLEKMMFCSGNKHFISHYKCYYDFHLKLCSKCQLNQIN